LNVDLSDTDNWHNITTSLVLAHKVRRGFLILAFNNTTYRNSKFGREADC